MTTTTPPENPANALTKHDKQLMAAGMRWQLSTVSGMPAGLRTPAALSALFSSLGCDFAPGELEARRDDLLTDPDFAEAYAAAATAEGWREFLARQ